VTRRRTGKRLKRIEAGEATDRKPVTMTPILFDVISSTPSPTQAKSDLFLPLSVRHIPTYRGGCCSSGGGVGGGDGRPQPQWRHLAIEMRIRITMKNDSIE
jgi:hypothetical protein